MARRRLLPALCLALLGSAAFAAEPAIAVQLLSMGESRRDRQLPPQEHAAWAQVASLLLNLSETVTRQ